MSFMDLEKQQITHVFYNSFELCLLLSIYIFSECDLLLSLLRKRIDTL